MSWLMVAALRIHVSPECHDVLLQLGGYELQSRGKVLMKGKGEINTYFLTGNQAPFSYSCSL